MTNEQKEDVLWNLAYAQRMLQDIAGGQHPDAQALADRRMFADWKLCRLLHKLVPALPEDLRAEVEACSTLREFVWSPTYAETYYQAKEKTSSESLATAS